MGAKQHYTVLLKASLTRAVFFTFFLGLVFFFAHSAKAAGVPAIITYQGKITQSNVSVNTPLSVRFVIYDAQNAGNPLYTAAGSVNNPSGVAVLPSYGTFTVDLGGAGTNPLGSDIFQNNSSLYLEVTINGETLSPRKQITTAPFAFNAQYLGGHAATSTPTSSAYIPISDTRGNFTFNGVTFTNATGTNLAVTSCSGCSYFNIFKYGATGDGVTDDAPAFQRALNDMASSSGGVLLVPPYLPNGRPALYAWKTPVTASFVNSLGIGYRSRWEIDGQGARIFVTDPLGSPFTALKIENASQFVIRGMRFYGVMDPAKWNIAPNPLKNVVYGKNSSLSIIDSQFNGFLIKTPNPNPGAAVGTNAVVQGDGLSIENCIFSSIGGTGRPIVRADQWTDFWMNKTTFADFYFIDNTFFAPLSSNVPYAAVFVGEPLPPIGGDSIYGANRATISNSRFDEGQGYYQIYVGGGPTYVKYVEIIGNNQNVNPSNASRGIYLYKVRHALVQGNFQREGGNGSKGISAQFVDDLIVKQNYVEAGSNVRTLDFDNTVQSVKLIDSDYTTSTSKALFNYAESVGNIFMPRDLFVGGFSTFATATFANATVNKLTAAEANFSTATTTALSWVDAVATNVTLSGLLTASGPVLFGTSTNPATPYKVFIDAGTSSNPALGVNGYIKASGYITGSSTLDVAETYPVNTACRNTGECPQPGDVVCVSAGNAATIEKCTEEYSTKMLGVVSTKPGFALGGWGTIDERQVALAGRVPVKVSLANGTIKRGDRLTSSNIPGIAVKAVLPGPTVAIALDDADGLPDAIVSVLGFISVNEFSLSSDWNIPTTTVTVDTLPSPLRKLLSLITSLLRAAGVFIENGIVRVGEFWADHITTSEIQSKKLCLDDVCLTRDELKTLLEKNSVSPAVVTPALKPVATPKNAAPVSTSTDAITTTSDSVNDAAESTTTPPATSDQAATTPGPTTEQTDPIVPIDTSTTITQ